MKIILIDKETNIVTGVTYLQSLKEIPIFLIGIKIEENDNFDYMWRKYNPETKKFSEDIFKFNGVK